MPDLVFESTRTVTQPQFAEWTAECERAGSRAHYELLDGKVVMTPPAGHPHGEIESRVHVLLGSHVVEHRLGKTFGSSQGFELPTGDTVEPDASFVTTARWKAAPQPERGKFLRVVPDLVVEIVSAATASHDRGAKKAIYERAGVREYWLIDDRAREVAVFNLEGERYGEERVFTPGERVRSEVLKKLGFDAADIFP